MRTKYATLVILAMVGMLAGCGRTYRQEQVTGTIKQVTPELVMQLDGTEGKPKSFWPVCGAAPMWIGLHAKVDFYWFERNDWSDTYGECYIITKVTAQ